MHHSTNKLFRFLAASLFAWVYATGEASAQAYPSKLVRIIVPNAAGGPSDVVGRLLAQKLPEALGQSVILENRVGAAGNIGTDMVAKSTPDGHTLLFTSSGPITINPAVYPKMPYDAIKDLAPIAMLASSPLVLTVPPGLPVNSVAELVRYAKSNPGKLNYASTGIGNNQHLAFELLKSQSGIDIVHVPYRGITQVVAAVMAGEVSMYFDTMLVLANARAGKVKPLAVTSRTRSVFAPDWPTLFESGYPEYDQVLWFGLFAPAGTSPSIVARLQSESIRALAQPDSKEKLSNLGFEAVVSTPEQFAARIAAESATWSKLVKALGIRAE